MNSSTTAIQIRFLEIINEQLRLEVASQQTVVSDQVTYWPLFVLSGLASFSAWTLSWLPV